MPKYKFNGINSQNKKIKGVREFRDENDAYIQLKKEGVYAFKIKEIKQKEKKSYKMNSMELSDFSRQIGSMQQSGISIVKAISILRDRTQDPKIFEIYDKIYKVINQGNSLSSAMENLVGSFPNLMINMYKSGEYTGKLDEVAIKMAIFYEKEHKLNLKVKNAMAYPSILAGLTVLVTLGMFTVILPNFFEMYADMELPLITKILIAISNFIIQKWYILILATGLIVLIIIYLNSQEKAKEVMDKYRLKVKIFGRLFSIIYTARFATTLSSLYSSGISMIDSVEISATTIGNKFIENQFAEVVSKIKDGNSLSFAITEVIGFDKKLMSYIYVGEESGKLDDMLESISETFEYEADNAIEKLITYIEPIMIITMAVIIGSVMIGVMVPLFDSYGTFG